LRLRHRIERVFDRDLTCSRRHRLSYGSRVPVSSGGATPEDGESAGYVTRPGRSRNMAAIRRKDTKPEVAMRSLLHRSGYRFRKDYPIRVEKRLVRPDVAFTKRRLAVFIDGCFWHSCPEHGRQPSVNGEYWLPKLQRNVERDRQQSDALKMAGWTVLRFWEHESSEQVLRAIIENLTRPQPQRR
jgi:DNA mismatch endonuclease, patch repair protein